MPCSLCRSSTHNRRSASCPVNIANRNGRRHTAELRPRSRQSILQQAFSGPVEISETNTSTQYMGPTGLTSPSHPTGQTGITMSSVDPGYYILPHDEELNAYMLLYKNLRPISQYDDGQFNVMYNIYRLLEIPGQPAIPQHYISQTNNKVIIRRIGAIYFTAIGVYDGYNYNIRRLDRCEMPNANDNVCIMIPQIPGFNTPIIEPVVSAKTVFENHITQITYEINEPDVESSLPCGNTCAVCLDTIEPEHFVITNCKHGYCASCIAKHIKTQQTKFYNLTFIPKEMVELPCPLCRTNIDKLVFIQEEQQYLMRIFITDEILP